MRKFNGSKNSWGFEVILTLYGCDPKLMIDTIKFQKYIDEICDLIAMEKHGKTIIERFGEDALEGYTVVQLIETSSITIHFDETWNQVFLNIFSCKIFDPELAITYSENFFGSKSSDWQLKERGDKQHYSEDGDRK